MKIKIAPIKNAISFFIGAILTAVPPDFGLSEPLFLRLVAARIPYAYDSRLFKHLQPLDDKADFFVPLGYFADSGDTGVCDDA